VLLKWSVCVIVRIHVHVIDVQGSVRRKKKVVVREHGSDEKKIQSVLKKIGLSEIPSIDEVVHVLLDCPLSKSQIYSVQIAIVMVASVCVTSKHGSFSHVHQVSPICIPI